VPLLATPSGAASNSTLVERHIDDLPRAKGKTKEKLNLEDTIYLDLSYGRVVIKLHPELAPKTVARFKELARQGFYDGLVFHRVIDGFMAQTGDPRGDGTGGSGQNLNAEFNSGKHVRGAVSMARAANINSADSQFYIVLADAPHLDGQYTYFGEVVSGMEFVDEIRKGDPRRNGQVAYPDHILRMQVAADADKAGTAEASAAKPAKKNEPKGG
jgi:peptidylprolyl isomerase